MSFITDITRAGGMLSGAISQTINTITGRVVLPIPILPAHPVGDVLEGGSDAARAGADAVERLVDAITGEARTRVDENAVRERRPLLASEQVVIDADPATATVIRFHARSNGVDWGRAGSESARVAVYVDGRYHSTVTVLAERPDAYGVNLAGVAPGAHHVELRDAGDTTRRGSALVAVSALRAERLTGDAGLVQRHAPIVQLADPDPTGAHAASYTDTPLLLVPAVTRHDDGSRTIAYRVAFSNEEGGTPSPKLLATYGRTGDLEPIYRVRVGADGRVLEATYQSALHRWRSFDGVRVGDRPVLRVATSNNNFSTRVRAAGDGAERWSEVALDGIGADVSDFEVMAAHPWTWTVMAKEIVREGKASAPHSDAVRGRHQVADPRRYLYVGPLSDAARGAIEAAGGIAVILADGRRVLARTVSGFAAGPQGQGALELPSGVLGDAVRGVALLGVRAAVLGPGYVMRELEQLAAA